MCSFCLLNRIDKYCCAHPYPAARLATMNWKVFILVEACSVAIGPHEALRLYEYSITAVGTGGRTIAAAAAVV